MQEDDEMCFASGGLASAGLSSEKNMLLLAQTIHCLHDFLWLGFRLFLNKAGKWLENIYELYFSTNYPWPQVDNKKLSILVPVLLMVRTQLKQFLIIEQKIAGMKMKITSSQ